MFAFDTVQYLSLIILGIALIGLLVHEFYE